MNTPRTPSLDDLKPDQRAALTLFRNYHGSTWKAKLNDHYQAGRDAVVVYDDEGRHEIGAFLRQIRNQRGPQWLANLKD